MKIAALLLLLSLASIPAPAQTFFRHRATASTVGLSFHRPIFASGTSGYSGFVATAAGAFPLGHGTAFLAEVPFMQGSYANAFTGPRDEFAVGNPFVGLQFGPEEGITYVDLGVRLPFASEEKPVAASVADATDIRHFEAYTPNVLQLSAAVNADAEISPSLYLLGRIGPSALFQTKGSSTSSLYAEYGATVEARTPDLALWVGWAARTQLTNTNSTDNTIDEGEVGGTYSWGAYSVGVRLRAPLDEYLRRVVDWTYGATVTAAF